MSVEPPKPQGNPSPPFIATAPALEALALLDRGLGAREPFVVVTGEPGVGKTTLVREALRRWGSLVHPRWLSPFLLHGAIGEFSLSSCPLGRPSR